MNINFIQEGLMVSYDFPVIDLTREGPNMDHPWDNKELAAIFSDKSSADHKSGQCLSIITMYCRILGHCNVTLV